LSSEYASPSAFCGLLSAPISPNALPNFSTSFPSLLHLLYLLLNSFGQKLFQPYGNILQAKVICSKTTNESLTYGFVMFEREEDATRAVQELNGFYIFGKQLKVSIARPRDGGGKGCKLHVSKLPAHFTWEMVNSLFAQVNLTYPLAVLSSRYCDLCL
jgi:hypothetical protein